MDIRYVFGDATTCSGDPTLGGGHIIAHVCNDRGAWGAGFTRSLSTRYPWAETVYRTLKPADLELGNIQITPVDPGVYVANMIAQDGLIGRDNRRPLNYAALGECLNKLGKFAQAGGYAIHMPRIGCGLAGGDWMYVEKLVYDALVRRAVITFVYDYNPEA